METEKVRQAFEQLDRVKELRAWRDCSPTEARERDSELDDLWEGFRAGAAYAHPPAERPGKYPIDRPCSACSAGDDEMKYHDHHPPFRKGYGPPAERPAATASMGAWMRFDDVRAGERTGSSSECPRCGSTDRGVFLGKADGCTFENHDDWHDAGAKGSR